MTVTARKYNPGFLTDEELMASFCVRTGEFESIIEMLRECTGPSNPHQIVIGPRGSGKTSLLLRVAAEVRRDPELSRGFFPVVFAEESYEVDTAGEFWLETLSRLADQAPHQKDAPDLHRTFADLRTIQDDRTLGERCLGALLDFSDREGKRLVLMVENLGMMFKDMSDPQAGWRLRKVLQTEPRIILLASATSRFDEIDHPDHALYDLLRVRTLRPLDTDECTVLWEAVAGKRPRSETIRSLEILTGGSPRLVAIVARFGAGRSFRELMEDLLDLVDDHTEYFKSHIESLPAQERRVYLALADLWKPATTREIADRTRIETSKCSAQLTRLTERGVVQVTGGSARRKQYYLTERLYNIYYLLRRNRGPDSLIETLIQFMESYYSPTELLEIGAGIAREMEGFDTERQMLHRTAFARLVELPALAGHRDELLAMIPQSFLKPDRSPVLSNGADTASVGTDESTELAAATDLFNNAVELQNRNRPKEALAAYDELTRRFGGKETPAVLGLVARALVNKGALVVGRDLLGGLNLEEDALTALVERINRFGSNDTPALPDLISMMGVNKESGIDRVQTALDTYDEVVRRFGESETPHLLEPVAEALLDKGTVLVGFNQLEEALAIYDEVQRRFGESEVPNLLVMVATAFVRKAALLSGLNRPQNALSTYGEVVQRFGESQIPDLLEPVAAALVGKGGLLLGLNRQRAALAAYDEVLVRFGESQTPAIDQLVAQALVNKGGILSHLNRPEEALAALDEVVHRFGESETPALLRWVSNALVGKGFTLDELNRPEEALAVFEEVVTRFGKTEIPMVPQAVTMALFYKGITLGRLDRSKEALPAYDEVVRRFDEGETSVALEFVAKAFVHKGVELIKLNRTEEALAPLNEVVRRFRESETPAVLEMVASAFVGKGIILNDLNRSEQALAVFDEMLRRFEESEIHAVLKQVAIALVNRGGILMGLNRKEEALVAFDEVVRRFGVNDSTGFRMPTERALLGKAELELGFSKYVAAAKTASRLLDEPRTESPVSRWRGHLIRAKATLANEDPASCERDIKVILAILPNLDSLPSETLDALMEFSIDLGQVRMCEIIQASPSARLLLPLTTALEQEIGREPRVAREVEEVARDIRRDLARLREARADGSEQRHGEPRGRSGG